MPQGLELTLYYREDCHLCEQFRYELEAFLPQGHFQLSAVDIDRDPELVKQYGLLIPLLQMGDQVLMQYFFDAEVLQNLA